MTSSATPPDTLSATPAGPAAPPAPETAPPTAPPTARPAPLLLGLLALFGVIALLLLAPGRMTVSTMEGDVLHLLDGVTRMRMGQWPHVDFATPLGALAYLPVSAWGDLGLGRAMALSHATAAAVCLPALVWIGLSRLRLGMALALGAVVLVTAATLAWSPDSQGATAAMSYNHWGWALVMQGLALMLLDRAGATARGATGREATGRGRAAARTGALIDGLMIGALGAVLVFLKATFAVGLAGMWLVWVLTGAERRAIAASVLAGLGLAAAFAAAFGGVEVAQAYIGDLLRVAEAGEARPMSQKPALITFVTPSGLTVMIGALIGALALARGGRGRAAIRFFAACVAAHLLAWQNFGYDPTAMTALALILLAQSGGLIPGALAFGRPAATVALCAGLVIFGVRAPGLLNSARSFFHLFAAPPEQFAVLADFAPDVIWQRAQSDFSGRFKLLPEDDEPLSLGGITQPTCTVLAGGPGLIAEAAAAILETPALRGRSVLSLDLVNPLWMLTGAPPQAGAWNWVYGPSPAQIAGAELLALPRCPYAPPITRMMAEEAATSGRAMRVALRTPNWTIFEPGPVGSAPVPAPAQEAEGPEGAED